MPRSLAAVALLALLAGCVQSGVDPAATLDPEGLVGGALGFLPMKLIDEVRAGGEPVIQVTQKGTLLVSAHPGWTHTRYPPSLNLVTPASGQSYLWRSEDHGETWEPIGLPGANGAGPRGVGQGVSDPDFAMDANGRIYLTDLEALAAASVSWSDDDGRTWLMGNNLASTYGPVDRQWLATHGTDVYFMGNYFADERVLKSADGGLTWMQVGSANCGQDLVVRESDGALLVGCGAGIDVSTDGGKTFTVKSVPDHESDARVMTEPAIDAAGNVYVAWTEEDGVYLAGTPDLGETWSAPLRVTDGLPTRTHIWPWVVAGDAGRVAVVWYATEAEGGPSEAEGDWFVYQATVLDAMGPAPALVNAKVTETPIFQGGICQRGTTCQLDPSPEGDRRLGDFFEAALDHEGYVNVVYSVALGDAISHPGYSRQTSGPSLYLVPRVAGEE